MKGAMKWRRSCGPKKWSWGPILPLPLISLCMTISGFESSGFHFPGCSRSSLGVPSSSRHQWALGRGLSGFCPVTVIPAVDRYHIPGSCGYVLRWGVEERSWQWGVALRFLNLLTSDRDLTRNRQNYSHQVNASWWISTLFFLYVLVDKVGA